MSRTKDMFLALQSTSALEVGLEPSAESWNVDLCPWVLRSESVGGSSPWLSVLGSELIQPVVILSPANQLRPLVCLTHREKHCSFNFR